MFRTELTIPPASRQLPRTARVLTLGSCFADSMGTRLLANKVETLVNPFGTVFQPLAAAQLLRAATGDTVDWQQHVVEARGRWQSYDLHGSIGAASPVELLQTIQQLVQRTADFVRSTNLVVLTLGTAWAYRLRETGELVSNCHKMPADLFVKELLTPDEIINALAETHAYLRRINPQVEIVLSVSPVRHLKDTLPLNAVSKSVLRVACHYLSDLLAGVSYFPAYELLTDDLRDYRFYAADMLHPSEVAEEYIWEKFARTYFDVDFGRFRKEWTAIRHSLGHRPLHDGAPEHRQFLENTLERLRRLAGQQVPVEAELRDLEQRLAALPVPALPVRQPEPEDDGEERIDIGEQATMEVATAEEQLASSPTPADGGARPDRLVPDEFRRQRGDRDRRGRDERRHGRPEPAKAAEQVLPALPAAEEVAALAAPDAEETDFQEEFASARDVLGLGSSASVTASVPAALEPGVAPVDSEEPLKKKKRRSRGGAKRTARKHAARLAAEGGEPTADAEQQLPTTEVIAPVVLFEATEVTPLPEEPTPVPATETQTPLSDAPATDVPVVDEVLVTEELPGEGPATESSAAEVPAPQAADEAPVRRGEPRAGKKSTVIAKSTPVKRGSRREAGARAAAAPQPTPAPQAETTSPLVEVADEVTPLATPEADTPSPVLTVPEITVPDQPAAVPAGKNRGRNTKNRSETIPPVSVADGPAATADAGEVPTATAAPAPAGQAPSRPRPKGPKRQTLYNVPAVELSAAEAPAALVEPTAPVAPVSKPAPKSARKPAKPTAQPTTDEAPAPPAPAEKPAAAKRRSRPATAPASADAADATPPAPKAKAKAKAADSKPKPPAKPRGGATQKT